MPIPFRSDLVPFLEEFVEQHRGLRLGRMFGLPAGYAGRKLFACLIEDGVMMLLPTERARDEIRTRRARPYEKFRPKPGGAWVVYRPASAVAARRLAPLLELAARHAAQRK